MKKYGAIYGSVILMGVIEMEKIEMKQENSQRSEPVFIGEVDGFCKFRWPDTGEEVYGRIAIMPESAEIREDVRLVFYIDQSMSIAEQIAKLRSIVVALQERTAGEIMKEAKSSRAIDLGIFYYWDAVELSSKAKVEGIRIEMITLPK